MKFGPVLWLTLTVGAVIGCGDDAEQQPSDQKSPSESEAAAAADAEEALSQNSEPEDTESSLVDEAREALSGFAMAQRLQDSEAWKQADDTLNRIGKDALPALLDGLKSKDAVVREQASARIAQLVEHLPERQQLSEALSDSSVWVRVNVASAMSYGQDQAEKVVPILCELCTAEESNLREQVAVALGNYGEKAASAVDHLVQLLKAEEPRVRAAAATALGKIGPLAQKAVGPLRERLNDSMQEVREAAAQAIRLIANDQ